MPSTPADIDYVVIPNYPMEPAPEPAVEATIEEPPAPVESFWEAVILAMRNLGIDLTRGEANEP